MNMAIPTKMSTCFRLGVALVLSCGIWQIAYCQERARDFHEHEFRGADPREHEFHDHAFHEREYQDRRFLDPRYHHNHYYPPVGFVFGALPLGYQITSTGLTGTCTLPAVCGTGRLGLAAT
jgi:hypothetical protein